MYLSLIVCMLTACSQEEKILIEKKIEFSFTQILPENGNSARTTSLSEPTALLVTITDAEGSIVADRKELVLFKFGETFLSAPLTLKTSQGATYKLTEFFVLGENHQVAYVTPKEGSELAHLVSDALDIEFAIVKDQITTVTPEVLSVDNSTNPTQYGYGQFGFNVVETISTVFSSFIKGSNNFELTESHVKIEGLSDSHSPDATILWTYEIDLPAIATKITLREATAYRVTASKPGYSVWGRTLTLTDNEKIEILFDANESNIIWNKKYGTAGDESIDQVFATSDGGVIMVANSFSTDRVVTPTSGGSDTWIVKLNSSGAIEWEKMLGTSTNEFGLTTTEYPDGSGYLISGYTYGSTPDGTNVDNGWIMKLDYMGGLIWKKDLLGTRYYKIANSLLNLNHFMVIARDFAGEINAEGDILWRKSIDLPISYHEPFVQTSNGYIGTSDGIAFKLNLQGEIQWRKGNSYNALEYLDYNKIFADEDGYTVIGIQWKNPVNSSMKPDFTYLAKLNEQGEMLWKKRITPENDIIAKDAIKTTQGNFIIAGHLNAPGYHSYGAVLEIDANAQIVKSKIFSGTTTNDREGGTGVLRHILPNQSDYFVFGHTDRVGGDMPSTNYGGWDLWGMRIQF